jgi:hypothetical protein
MPDREFRSGRSGMSPALATAMTTAGTFPQVAVLANGLYVNYVAWS